MNLFTTSEIETLAQGGAILRRILNSVAAAVKPGVTGVELNALAEKLIAEAGAVPAFKGYGQPPYPNALCVSINDCVVHGIASDLPLNEGDIVSLDCGLQYEGLYTDAAITVPVGQVSPAAQKLISAAQEALAVAIRTIKPEITLGDLGAAIQGYIESRGLSVVREYTGHGVGRKVHDEPSVPNYGQAKQGLKLTAGLVLAIEPMLTNGDWHVKVGPNHWDVLTADGSLASHFEDTIVVTTDGCRVLTK